MTIESKVIVPRVDKFGPPPTNPVEALVQARAFLKEEGQWITGSMFEDGDPKEAYEKSMCGSWSACSMGALGLVTGEMPISVCKSVPDIPDYEQRQQWVEAVACGETELGLDEFIEQQNNDDHAEFWFEGGDVCYDAHTTPMSYEAARFVALGAALVDGVGLYSAMETPVDAVIGFNDRDSSQDYGRTRVLEAFEKGIELAVAGRLPVWNDEGHNYVWPDED